MHYGSNGLRVPPIGCRLSIAILPLMTQIPLA